MMTATDRYELARDAYVAPTNWGSEWCIAAHYADGKLYAMAVKYAQRYGHEVVEAGMTIDQALAVHRMLHGGNLTWISG
jgi:hypothetical protein